MTFALLCAGQGAQHASMLDLAKGNAAAEAVLAQGCNEAGESIADFIARPTDWFENRVAQPLICLGELATWVALGPLVPPPTAIAGYSVGELAAYGCAGALDATELTRLASTRARLMDAALGERQSGLVALAGLDRAEAQALCAAEQAFLAIVTSEDTCVAGGEVANLGRVSAVASARGARVTELRVGLAAHTPLLASAVRLFEQELARSTLKAPRLPVVAGIDASWVNDRERAIEKLARQLAMTIEWSSCMDALFERGCRVFLELGPGRALASMVERRFRGLVQARSVDDFRSLGGAAAWINRSVEGTRAV